MATQFFQLRPGDSFELEGITYIKLNTGKTFEDGTPFNARATDETLRFVLQNTKVTPTDDYYLNRITPYDAPQNPVGSGHQH